MFLSNKILFYLIIKYKLILFDIFQKIVLIKILILEINEISFIFFFWSFKRKFSYYWFTKSMFLFKLLKLIVNLTYMELFFIFYLIGLMRLCFKRFHLLIILLRIEFIVLVLYFLIIFYLNFFEGELFFSILFLRFRVCEGVLGLSILIKIVRLNGNDYFHVLNFL